MKLFAKPEDPKKVVRESKNALNRQARGLDREIAGLRREEEKLKRVCEQRNLPVSGLHCDGSPAEPGASLPVLLSFWQLPLKLPSLLYLAGHPSRSEKKRDGYGKSSCKGGAALRHGQLRHVVVLSTVRTHSPSPESIARPSCQCLAAAMLLNVPPCLIPPDMGLSGLCIIAVVGAPSWADYQATE